MRLSLARSLCEVRSFRRSDTLNLTANPNAACYTYLGDGLVLCAADQAGSPRCRGASASACASRGAGLHRGLHLSRSSAKRHLEILRSVRCVNSGKIHRNSIAIGAPHAKAFARYFPCQTICKVCQIGFCSPHLCPSHLTCTGMLSTRVGILTLGKLTWALGSNASKASTRCVLLTHCEGTVKRSDHPCR